MQRLDGRANDMWVSINSTSEGVMTEGGWLREMGASQ